MLKREFVEQFLRLNNVSESASDDEVRELLHSAKWSDAEIEEAITIISTDPTEDGERSGEKETTDIFQHNFDRSSERLSALLGVDVVVHPSKLRAAGGEERTLKDQRISVIMGIVITILALCVAAALGISVAYLTESGPFHVAAEEFIF